MKCGKEVRSLSKHKWVVACGSVSRILSLVHGSSHTHTKRYLIAWPIDFLIQHDVTSVTYATSLFSLQAAASDGEFVDIFFIFIISIFLTLVSLVLLCFFSFILPFSLIWLSFFLFPPFFNFLSFLFPCVIISLFHFFAILPRILFVYHHYPSTS